jgi:cell division protein FtsN
MTTGLILAILLQAFPAEWFWERYDARDLAAIKAQLVDLPDSTDYGKFFRALLTHESMSAIEQYERIVKNFPGTRAGMEASTRITDYYGRTGKPDIVKPARDREPVPETVVVKVVEAAPTPKSPPVESPRVQVSRTEVTPTTPQNLWTVQAGAFRNPNGAETIRKKIAKFGKVELVPLDSKSGTVTAVRIGVFDNIPEAERLAQEIREKTGVETAVIRIRK